MPALVAAQRLIALFDGLEDGAIGLQIGDRHRLGAAVAQHFDGAEAVSEGDLFRIGEMLLRKHQSAVLVKGVLHRPPFGGRHGSQFHIGNAGAEAGVERRDGRHAMQSPCIRTGF